MKKTLLLAFLTMFLAIGTVKAQGTDKQKYSGKIGKYEITLFMEVADNDGDVVGYYYYNNRPKTKFTLRQKKYEVINLSGSMHIILNEYTPTGFHSGTFDGQLEGRGGCYKGKFTNSEGKVFNFELWEQWE